MTQDTDHAAFDETEAEFWRAAAGRHGAFSQVRAMYFELIPKLRERSLKEGLSPCAYAERLDKARDIVGDLTAAMKAYWLDAPEDRFWAFPRVSMDGQPKEWSQPSPVDPGELERATAEYLKLPWMQVDLADWYLLNAFVFDAIARLQDEIFSGSVLGRINWSYALAEGRIYKALLYRFGFGLVAFCLRWLLLPAAIVYLLYQGRNDLLPWIAVPYAVYVVYRLATLPARVLRRRREKKVLATLDTTFRQMIAVYQTATARTFNPTRLQEQVRLAEGSATYFRPAMHSLLARVVERDASVFSI